MKREMEDGLKDQGFDSSIEGIALVCCGKDVTESKDKAVHLLSVYSNSHLWSGNVNHGQK